ncbi:glycosyltransferase, family 2 [Bacillus sp. JCM 19047]|nr:glycosyltransferase, family 2 [Bacillus sp. JCM 19047]
MEQNDQEQELVSILIPMRNEENNVAPLIHSLARLTYQNVEFIFLNDQSTDDTLLRLKEMIHTLPNASVIEGKELPAKWVGKVHACHQLSRHANGHYFFFLDADITLQPHTIEALLQQVRPKHLGLVSGFPKFPVKGTAWLCQLLVPMQHVIIYLHLPLFLANYTRMPMASAAHGSFLFFSRTCYEAIGGHKAIYNSLTEDIQLMRNSKKAGFTTRLVNNTGVASCVMYDTNGEVWAGFSKNSFPGIGRSYILGGCLLLFYLVAFVAPFFFALYGLLTFHLQFILPYVLTVLMMVWINAQAKQRLVLSLLVPFSALSLMSLLLYSMLLSKRAGYTWKGRVYK